MVIERADLEDHNKARGRLYGLIHQLRLAKVAPVSTREFNAKGLKARLDFVNEVLHTEHEFLNDLTSTEINAMSDKLAEYFGIEDA